MARLNLSAFTGSLTIAGAPAQANTISALRIAVTGPHGSAPS